MTVATYRFRGRVCTRSHVGSGSNMSGAEDVVVEIPRETRTRFDGVRATPTLVSETRPRWKRELASKMPVVARRFFAFASVRSKLPYHENRNASDSRLSKDA